VRNGITDDPDDPRLTHGSDDTPAPQADTYLVLSDTERAQGFRRPVRLAYLHQPCGQVTVMAREIAETYARQPDFYGSTYCVHCRQHRRVGADGEFVWQGTDEKVGT
jgi:hypothetical protein